MVASGVECEPRLGRGGERAKGKLAVGGYEPVPYSTLARRSAQTPGDDRPARDGFPVDQLTTVAWRHLKFQQSPTISMAPNVGRRARTSCFIACINSS